MRICHLGKYYAPASGGIETHIRLLARGQAELGHEVTVACVEHRDRSGRDVTWSRFRGTASGSERDDLVRVVRVGRRASLARFDVCPALGATLSELAARADVFHLHAPNPTVLLALLLRARSVPLVVTHHSDVIRQRFLGLALRPFERRVYGRARVLLSDSPTYIDGSPTLKRFLDKVRVLPLGIDRSPFAEPSSAARRIAAELRDRYPGPLWLSVGRLVYYKGLTNAVRALAEVPGTWLVVGTGPMEAELKRQAAAVGVANRIAWFGAADADTLIGAYRAATALWFPSNARSEGFGLVQVEAMAAGCPVINAAVPDSGVAWVSRHDREGLTIPMNDPSALAAAANRLHAETGLRERLAAAAAARAADEFDYRIMARRSLAIYEGLG